MSNETAEVKLPHHFSEKYKQMKADGLIDDKGKYVGEMDLAEYLGLDAATTEKPQEPEIHPQAPQEPTVPLSQVQDIVAKILAEEREKSANQTPQAIYQAPAYQYPKNDSNIDDIPELRNWEMKDREYELCDGTKPISLSIAKQHTAQIPLQYTNKETQTVHILRYATNQPSFFVEKQSKEPGSVLLADIILNYGRLKVPASNVVLQQFLAIHPHNGIVFKEYDPLAKSREIIAKKKLKLQANNLVFTVGETMNRAIASLEFAHYVDSWSPEILEEEILAFSDKDPKKYIAYTEDPTVKMKGVIKASLALGELIYSNYRFLNSKREVIIEVAKNQNEMDEMVKHFESGIGRTLYEYLVAKVTLK